MVNTSCLVPEFTNNELFDCCGSDGVILTCNAFASVFAVILVWVVFSLVYFNITNAWFRSNSVLSFCVFWQFMPALMRTLFYGKTGHASTDIWGATSADEYIMIRPSDQGDFLASLIAFLMYMY